MARSSFELADGGASNSDVGTTKMWKRVLVIVVGCLIIAALVAVIVVAVIKSTDDDSSTRDDDDDDPYEYTKEDLSRIDCFPEAQGGVEVATEAACLNRGCEWAPVDDTLPPCFVPQSAEFGFRNRSGPDDTPLGFRWILEPINEFAIYGENFQSVQFDVEFREDHLLRFKVGCVCAECSYLSSRKCSVCVECLHVHCRKCSGHPAYS